jgi:hypothetical protein
MQYQATILGEIWWPMGQLCSLTTSYRAESDEEAVESVYAHVGDFSHVVDVEITTGACRHDFRVVKAWSSDENESAYLDTLGDFE